MIRGFGRQCSGKRNALLFTAREHMRVLVCKARQSHTRQDSHGQSCYGLVPRFKPKGDILRHGQVRERARSPGTSGRWPWLLAVRGWRRRKPTRPSTATVPFCWRSTPAATLSVVDLPQPDGPSRQTISPAPTSSDRSSTACTLSNAQERPCKDSRGVWLVALTRNSRPVHSGDQLSTPTLAFKRADNPLAECKVSRQWGVKLGGCHAV